MARERSCLIKLSRLPVMLRGRNGIYIVKCQDEICGGKFCPTHIELVLEFAKLFRQTLFSFVADKVPKTGTVRIITKEIYGKKPSGSKKPHCR
jgi:hypothetical protein